MPLRVLAVLHSPALYGAQRSFLEVLRHTARHDLEYLVALPSDGPISASLNDLRVPFEMTGHRAWIPTVSSTSRSYWLRFFKEAIATQRRIRSLIDRVKPDVIYTNTVTVIDGALAARSASIPHVWHLREAVRGNQQLKSLLPQRLVWPIVTKLSDRVIFNSRFLERQYESSNSSKCSVIYNGIEVSPIVGEHRLQGMSSAKPTILTVGYMDRHKGLDVLLDAARLLAARGLEFRVVVAGQVRPEYRVREIEPRIADPLLAGRVELLGWQENMEELYERASVLVSSSRQESFGRTILEAMACGVPVVSTRSGGPEEIVVNGETGLLTPVGDPNALANAMALVLSDSALATSFGQAGRAAAAARFSIAAMAAGVTRVLREAARRERSTP